MAVIGIGAVVGVGAVVGIARSDPYSDYSDYSCHYDHSDYSDAEVRRQRRISAKKEEINNQTYTVNSYKTDTVNGYLMSQHLKQQSGVDVSVSAVKKDGDAAIESTIKTNTDRETAEINREIAQLKDVIGAIDRILEENA